MRHPGMRHPECPGGGERGPERRHACVVSVPDADAPGADHLRVTGAEEDDRVVPGDDDLVTAPVTTDHAAAAAGAR
jgi:hypothetical protein